MEKLFYVVLLSLFHLSLQSNQPGCNEKCKYPESPQPLNWTKLEGMTFYLSLHDGSIESKEVACVVQTNITAVVGGYRSTILKYTHDSPKKPQFLTLRFITVNGGYYEVLQRVAAKLGLPDLIEKDGRINWRKEFEDIHVALEEPPYMLSDYQNYVIVIRCFKNGNWYVRPYVRNPVPTAEDVLHVWKALHDNGIYLPLYVGDCHKIL